MAGNTQRTTARKAPRKKPSIYPFEFSGTLFIGGRRFQEVTGYPQGKPFPKHYLAVMNEHREAMRLLRVVQRAWWAYRLSDSFYRRLAKILRPPK